MKKCPDCQRVVEDDAMIFCAFEGSILLKTEDNPNAFADTIKPESPDSEPPVDPSLERAAEVARKVEYRNSLYTLRNSEEGVGLAHAEIQSMFSYIESKVELINQNHPLLEIQFERNSTRGREATIFNPAREVIISWKPAYTNTLSESSLEIAEWKRSEGFVKESDELNRVSFDFYLNEDLKLCWKDKDSSNTRYLTTEQLGQECIDRLLLLIKRG